jgi:pSer/pThr/pTyr-binding forkhead associated (FHA) protein
VGAVYALEQHIQSCTTHVEKNEVVHMKLSLIVVTEGKSAGKAIPITLSQFLIGRDPQCNLRPASAMISKRHCAVMVKDGRAFVRDFDSTNGTFINNDRIQGERELKNDDTLKVGPLEFRVALATPTPTPVNKPTPVPTKPDPAQNEEDVAAMLLSLQDDSPVGNAPKPEDVPAGSTVMDVVPGVAPETKEEVKDDKPAAKKPEPAKAAPANTSLAAKAILEKYTRRSRS